MATIKADDLTVGVEILLTYRPSRTVRVTEVSSRTEDKVFVVLDDGTGPLPAFFGRDEHLKLA